MKKIILSLSLLATSSFAFAGLITSPEQMSRMLNIQIQDMSGSTLDLNHGVDLTGKNSKGLECKVSVSPISITIYSEGLNGASSSERYVFNEYSTDAYYRVTALKRKFRMSSYSQDRMRLKGVIVKKKLSNKVSFKVYSKKFFEESTARHSVSCDIDLIQF